MNGQLTAVRRYAGGVPLQKRKILVGSAIGMLGGPNISLELNLMQATQEFRLVGRHFDPSL